MLLHSPLPQEDGHTMVSLWLHSHLWQTWTLVFSRFIEQIFFSLNYQSMNSVDLHCISLHMDA